MADTNTPAAPALSQEEQNKKVAEDLLKQGQENLPKPDDQAAAGDALDALAKEVVEKKETAPEPPATPPATEPTPEQVKAKEEADAAAKAAQEVADKIFKDSPSLPANASAKSSESFAAIKTKAVQEISQRDAEIEKLKKENADLAEKVKQPVPESVTKELEDHRAWRAKLDVDADPKFKKFDQEVAAAHEFIYAQLKKSPQVTDEIIAEIKKHGGPDRVNFSKLFEAMKDPTIQRLVEAKVADIELVKYNKDQAVKAAKDNISQYMEERTKQAEAASSQHNTATKARVSELATGLEWLKPKTVEAKADAATKKSVEEHNAFVTEVQNQLGAALQDDTAEMRAILLIGMAQLFNLQREHKASAAELAATKKELAETKEKWEKVKASGTSRLRESAAPANGGGAKSKTIAEQATMSAGDALDSIAKQVMEKRAAQSA